LWLLASTSNRPLDSLNQSSINSYNNPFVDLNSHLHSSQPPQSNINQYQHSNYNIQRSQVHHDAQFHNKINPHSLVNNINPKQGNNTSSTIIGLESYVPLQGPNVVTVDLLRPYTSPFNSSNLLPSTEPMSIVTLPPAQPPATTLLEGIKSNNPQLDTLFPLAFRHPTEHDDFDLNNPINLDPNFQITKEPLSFENIPPFIKRV
jgi:hypothetical protein